MFFNDAGLFVFLGAPTLRSLRETNGTLLDLPVFNRVCEIPFNFNITQVALETSTSAVCGYFLFLSFICKYLLFSTDKQTNVTSWGTTD